MTQKTMDLLKLLKHSVIFVVILCTWSNPADANNDASASYSQPFIVDIRMPGIRTSQEDEYLCYAWKVPDEELYIVKFEALASAVNVHHLLVFGCSDADDSTYRNNCYTPCTDGETAVFAWAQNAPQLELPADVGFKIGKNSKVKYIVIQLHYRMPISTSAPADHSGIQLTLTPLRQRYVAGILLMLVNNLRIPAHTEKVYADTSCRFNEEKDIYPFAFRTHAHSLCNVISGYQVNNTWHLIAKGNPQWPQAFYPMTSELVIHNGDYLVSRCRYDASNRSRDTYIGSTHNDEMCNLYVMYYTENGQNTYIVCMSNLFPDLFDHIPADNDVTLPPNPQLDAIATGRLHRGIEAVNDWPKIQPKDNLTLGQISGLAIDSNNHVHVFHRGSRVWETGSFRSDNRFAHVDDGPIPQKTIVEFDSQTGEVISQWGENLFYMPHGLDIDGNNSVWITDVALHQVMRFRVGSSTPDLIIGEQFVPGSDTTHFCKPTDVAVLSTGEFFVSDGYCNDRIVKFSSDGKFLLHWGKSSQNAGALASPLTFALPHSVTIAEDRGIVCVADRENGRALCFDLDGNLLHVIRSPQLGPALYAVTYDKYSGRLYAVNGPPSLAIEPAVIQTSIIDIDSGNVTYSWQPKSSGFTRPHDIAVSSDGRHIFVGEIGPNILWQFVNYNNVSKYMMSGEEVGTLDLCNVSNSNVSTLIILNMKRQLPQSVIVSLSVTALIFVVVVLSILVAIGMDECKRDRERGGWRRLDNGYRDGSPMSTFKPLIAQNKPYQDNPDSDDSENEEFNINVNLGSNKTHT